MEVTEAPDIALAQQSGASAKQGLDPPAGVTTHQVYTLGLLLIIYIFGFIDRQIVNVLAETLKKELDLHNWQLGLLTGFAFSIFYSTLGLPLAALADRGYRKKIITISVGIWSGFTILCGATHSFAQLFATRLGVGIGEAGGTPASHSIITAIMPRSRRALALSVYAMGVPIGTLVGMSLGGMTADLWGWRMAFVAAGLPGVLLCAVAALTLREPLRDPSAQVERIPMGKAFTEIAASRSVRWTMLGSASITLVFFGQSAFSASFLQRIYGPDLLDLGARFGLGPQGVVGAALGIAFFTGGLLGNLIGGLLADRVGNSNPGGYLTPPGLAAISCVPLSLGCYLTSDFVASLLFLIGVTTAGMIFYGPTFAAIHSVVRPELRSSASALTLVAVNLIGYGCGPLLVGIITDILAGPMAMGQGEGLRWSLVSVSTAGSAIAAWSFLRASRLMKAEMDGPDEAAELA